MTNKNILFFGFGTTQYIFKYIVDENLLSSYNNHLILPDDRYKKNFLNYENIHTTNKAISIDKYKYNLSLNINKLIDIDKRYIKQHHSRKQEKDTLLIYNNIVDIFENNNFDYVFFFQPIENIFGVLLQQISVKYNVKTYVPCHTRYFGTTFYSSNYMESPINFENVKLKESIKLYEDFKNNKISSSNFIDHHSKSLYDSYNKSDPFNFIKKVLKGEKKFEEIKVRFLNLGSNKFGFYIKKVHKFYNKNYFNISSIDEVKKLDKFIYFPLQYTPESSINVPSPYFVDQFRIIDIIRHNLPNDYKLVLKEHPSCIYNRNSSFYKKILKLSNVRLAKYDISSKSLIENSMLTVSVTGTACLEAFLLKKPSICFGATFFSNIVTTVDPLKNYDVLHDIFLNTQKKVITESDIINFISSVLQNSYHFNAISPGHPKKEYMFNVENVKRLCSFIRENF